MTFIKTTKKSPLIHRNIMIYSQFRPFPALTTKKKPKKTLFLALKNDKKKHGMAQNGTILSEKKHYSSKLKKVLKKSLFFNLSKFCVIFISAL